MSSVVTLQIQTASNNRRPPLEPIRSISSSFRKVMKKFFRPSTSSTPTTPNLESPLDRKSRFSRSTNLLVPDDSSSRRGKSLDGRPTLGGSNAGSTSSAIHLPCAEIQKAKDAAPPSSFRQHFRHKSMQPPAKSCSQQLSTEFMNSQQPDSAFYSKSKPPHASAGLHGVANPPHVPPRTRDLTPTSAGVVNRSSAPSKTTSPASTEGASSNATTTPTLRAPAGPPTASKVGTPRVLQATRPIVDNVQPKAPPACRDHQAPGAPAKPESPVLTQLQPSTTATIAPVLTASPSSMAVALPKTNVLEPPHPRTPSNGQVSPHPLRQRVEPSALPPRLSSLPGPSSFAAQLMSNSISGLPNNAYAHGDHTPAVGTPQPPGGFSAHLRSNTFSAGTPLSSAMMSPRRMMNVSTPGMYVMPSAEGATTLKMTPSLVTMRPDSIIGPVTPMRYPSLLVSGVSGGEVMGRSRGASESGAVRASTRSALPALRRDGSSFYINMPGPAAPAPAADEEDGESSDGTLGMEDMEEDRTPSDDETEEGATTPAAMPATATAKSILGKAVQAMARPLIQPSSPSSYFRRQPSGSVSSGSGEPSTPLATRREPSVTTSPAPHRLSLVASGAPSTLLSTVHDDHDGEIGQPAITAASPKAQPTATSNLEPLFHTPMQTPTPGLSDASGIRSTVYWDAESGVEEDDVAEMTDPRAASAFTTHSGGSASTMTFTRPPPPKATQSATTIKPETSAQPHVQFEAGSSDATLSSSALGLHVQNTPPTRGRSGTTAHPDYFSHRTSGVNVMSQADGATVRNSVRLSPHGLNARTPGGRPALYSQISHSMLDFGSSGMGEEDEPHTELRKRAGKGKEKEVSKEARAQSPPRSPKPRSPVVTRRMSLPDMSGHRALPPPYPQYSAREEEGKEVLPRYSCRIHFEASVMRKMEFTSPGLVARDRGWKRVYIIINGTSLSVFKHNPRMYPVKPRPAVTGGGGLDATARTGYSPGGKKGDGVVNVDDVVIGAPHVHLPEDVLPTVGVALKKTATRGSGSSINVGAGGSSGNVSRRSFDNPRRSSEQPRRSMAASRTSASSSSNTTFGSGSTAISSPGASSSNMDLMEVESPKVTSPVNSGPLSVLGQQRPSNSQSNYPGAGSSLLASFQSNVVLRQYSLANAETGLASDYLKRNNVIRVRAEGEQFLIQADNVLMAIDWIETFQAGANVALDLDERPMTKVPALPRRRRRRRPTAADEADPNGRDLQAASRDGQASSPNPPSPTRAASVQPSQASHRSIFGRRREAA